MAEERIGVVGAGILGLAVAREVGLRRPGAQVVVLEKEDRVAAHQTGHNSGVVHAGIYYPPHSLKARLCREGAVRLKEYCAEHDLPYTECGKLVVALTEAERPRLERLRDNAGINGVPGLAWREGGGAIREVEPHAAGVAALHSPTTAITDFTRVAEQYAADVMAAGGEVRLDFEVVRIDRRAGHIDVHARTPDTSEAAPVRVDRLVLCAGLQSDVVAGLAGGDPEPRIVPFRGEYLTLRPERRDLVRGLVYPVPDPRYPFLGVHFTRRVTGEVDVGPNAVLALAREGYRRSALSRGDLASLASWPGTWRLAREHWRTGVREVAGSASTRWYVRGARRYLPELRAEDVLRAGAGVRAQAVDRSGALVDDFRIVHHDGITEVRNAPSPAATSSLAIATHVVDRVLEGPAG